jgi:hypothetical protein
MIINLKQLELNDYVKIFMNQNKNYFITIFLLAISMNKGICQVEKYCLTDEVFSMYNQLSQEIKNKLDLNKSENLNLLSGIGTSFVFELSNEVLNYSTSELQSHLHLEEIEISSINLVDNNLKINFNSCIRIEYIKDRFKDLNIEINDFKGTNLFLIN